MNTVNVRPVSVEKLAPKYHDQLSSLEGDLAPIKEDIAQVLKEARGDGIHVKAFKLARSLRRLDPIKRDDFLASFDLYREQFGLDSQLKLDIEATTTASVAKPTRGNGKGNGSAPRAKGRRKASEPEPLQAA